jgi:uncharacterized Tic20 family protein
VTDDVNRTDSSEPTTERMNTDANMWAMFCHLGGLIGLAIPPLNIIVPLIIWMKYRDQFAFVNDQGMEALNFQISITIYSIVSSILILVVIGLFMLMCLGLFVLIVCIIATIQSSRGVSFRYPLTLRLIR